MRRAGVAFAILSAIAASPRSVFAQQVVANGTTVNATGTVDTGTTAGSAGYALWALNNGILTSSTPLTIITGGAAASAVVAQSGGQITITHGSTVTANGSSARALSAEGTGAGGAPSTITATDTVITSQATNDYSVYAIQGAMIHLDGGIVNHSGIWVDGNGMVDVTGATIDTSSPYPLGIGAKSYSGGHIYLDQTAIRTDGELLFGVSTGLGDPNSATVSNSSVTTSGDSASGVWANYSGPVTLTNVDITAVGAFSYGVRLYGYQFETATPSATSLTGTDVTANTNDWAAVVGGGLATLDLTDSAFYSALAGGLFISDFGNTDNVANLVNTTVVGGGAEAARVNGPGTLIATGSAFTGATDGIVSRGGGVSAPNDVITITGGSITAQGGDAIHAINTTSNITLTGPITISETSGNLLNVESDGARSAREDTMAVLPSTPTPYIAFADPLTSTVNFTMNGVVAAGNIISDSASTTTVDLANGTVLTGIQIADLVTVEAGSTWIMTGPSDIKSLTILGTVVFPVPADPTDPGSYIALTINSEIGRNGMFDLNTFLGSDGSPSDRIVIDGATATGTALLHIANTTGPGAQTLGNGILVVDTINQGTTTPSAFALATPVFAGGYAYSLFRGALDRSSADNWYLRSTPRGTMTCTQDRTYWQTHSSQGPGPLDPAWSAYENAPFFQSGQTYFDVISTNSGNPYYLLGVQYITAILNGTAGADLTVADPTIAQASALFAQYTPDEIDALPLDSPIRDQFMQAMQTLALFNEGALGPESCNSCCDAGPCDGGRDSGSDASDGGITMGDPGVGSGAGAGGDVSASGGGCSTGSINNHGASFPLGLGSALALLLVARARRARSARISITG